MFEAVSNMNGDKAPGLDGFSLSFFGACWDIVREDILKVFAEFYSYMRFEKSFNATFIALILKR